MKTLASLLRTASVVVAMAIAIPALGMSEAAATNSDCSSWAIGNDACATCMIDNCWSWACIVDGEWDGGAVCLNLPE